MGKKYEQHEMAHIQSLLRPWFTSVMEELPLKHLIVGVEMGDNTRHIHLQGCAYFDELTPLNTFSKTVEKHAPLEMEKVTCWKKACIADYVTANVPYCKKEGRFEEFGELPVAGQKKQSLQVCMDAINEGERNPRALRAKYPMVMSRHSAFISQYLVDTYKAPSVDVVLYPWQEEIVQLLEKNVKPHDREVIFICDPNGGAGKTTLLRYLISNYKDRIHACSPMGDAKIGDLAFMIPETGMDMFICDVSRCGELPYALLEGVKNGLVTSTKYASVNKMFPTPHVVVLTNLDASQLDRSRFTSDRFKIVSLTTDAGSSTIELFKK